MRHRLSVGSASGLSCGGDKYRDGRSGRTGDGRAGGSGREKEDDTKSAENVSRGVLPSRQSLLDLVSGKFMGRHTPTHHYYYQQQQQVGYRPREIAWLKYSFHHGKYPSEDIPRVNSDRYLSTSILSPVYSFPHICVSENEFAIPFTVEELRDLPQRENAYLYIYLCYSTSYSPCF